MLYSLNALQKRTAHNFADGNFFLKKGAVYERHGSGIRMYFGRKLTFIESTFFSASLSGLYPECRSVPFMRHERELFFAVKNSICSIINENADPYQRISVLISFSYRIKTNRVR